MKSRVYKISKFMLRLIDICRQIADDKIAVYAAQASFFVIISAVPFISLLISIISIAIPAELPDISSMFTVSDTAMDMLESVVTQLKSAPNVSLLSISAVTTLWSASKGIAAIRSGIEKVYHARHSENMLSHRLKSLITTLIFMLLIVGVVVLLLFGNFIFGLIGFIIPTEAIMNLRTPFLAAFMCIVFTVMYCSTAKRSVIMPSKFLSHLPGAALSSVGWILYSYFYSLYIKHFPSASYVYGGLAAVCLIMLWLYFCMMILLLGAELNKVIVVMRKRKLEEAAAVVGKNVDSNAR